jgi:hypothetical protein
VAKWESRAVCGISKQGSKVGFLRTTTNLVAYQLYLQGRYYWSKRGQGVATSIDLLKQAIVADPSYALAYAGLADAYSIAPPYTGMSPEQANALAAPAAHRALELDSQLPEAHAALPTVVAAEFKLNDAEAEFQIFSSRPTTRTSIISMPCLPWYR